MEGTGKLVLMDVSGSLEPKQQLDVKPRIVVDHELRLTKARLRLKRLLVIEQELVDDRRKIDVECGRSILQRVLRDVREIREREVLRHPPSPDGAPELREELIHIHGVLRDR